MVVGCVELVTSQIHYTPQNNCHWYTTCILPANCRLTWSHVFFLIWPRLAKKGQGGPTCQLAIHPLKQATSHPPNEHSHFVATWAYIDVANPWPSNMIPSQVPSLNSRHLRGPNWASPSKRTLHLSYILSFLANQNQKWPYLSSNTLMLLIFLDQFCNFGCLWMQINMFYCDHESLVWRYFYFLHLDWIQCI